MNKSNESELNKEKRVPPKWRGDLEDVLGYDQGAWRKRIVAVAAMLDESDASVLDLGAGNMYLGRLLSPNVKYIPVDYKKTSKDTIVCDFNNYEFPSITVDVICAIGILNYIADPEWFLKKIFGSCRKCIVTYKGREKYDYAMLYTDEIIDFAKKNDWIITKREESLDEWTLIATFEKKSVNIISDINNCTGCGCCVNVCPMDALRIEYNHEGYLRPVLSKTACVNCGKCIKSCPAINGLKNNINSITPTCYAFQANDEIRKKSSSGGFFSVISEYIIGMGGVVFGAEWDKDFCCKIIDGVSEDDIGAMRYSKYVQSDTGFSYRKAESYLKKDRKVVFFGCPCQIAGLEAYLECKKIGTKKDNLITVDLVCFCAPSNKLFQRYLNEEYGVKNVKNVTFRYKNSRGWSPVSYRIDLHDGTVLYPDPLEDPYQKAFHSVLARNDTCEKCMYYEFPRVGDISIGDFWGIEQHDASWNDGKGVSVILANNEKAKTIINEIEDYARIEEVPLEWCLNKGNRIGKGWRPSHDSKSYFEWLLSFKSVAEAVDMAINGKYDIGCVCMFNYNIGNNLTNMALYKTLTGMGLSVCMIGSPLDCEGADQFQGEERFGRFLKNPYHSWAVHPGNKNKWEYHEQAEKCAMFVVGSDQLWRGSLLKSVDYFYTIDWVSNKYKFSFATSMGTEDFDEENDVLAKSIYLINRLNRISVREASAAKLIKNKVNRDAEVVLDPVFLCDYNIYQSMARVGVMRLPCKKFIGAYLLDVTDDKIDVINMSLKILGLSDYCVITDYPEDNAQGVNILSKPGIEEWLALISNSDFFITDSFHGICFAIIFKKQFAVIFDKDNWRGWTRIENILKTFGLEDRLIEKVSDENVRHLLDNTVNYDEVYAILEKKKKKSFAFLKDAITEAKSYVGNYTSYDIINDRDNRIEQEIYDYQKCFNEIIKQQTQIFNGKAYLASLFCGRKTVGEIVAFGCGDCFRRNIGILKQVGGVRYACDNNPNKWGEYLTEDIECISPKMLQEMTNVAVVIMVDDVGVSFDIARQLVDIGQTNFTHISNILRKMQ